MNAPCMHTYSAGLAFSTTNQFPSLAPAQTSAPAYQSASVRQDVTQVLDATSQYYVETSNTAYCNCKGGLFYQNVVSNAIEKVIAYYQCSWNGTACILTKGKALYSRCNQTLTTICNTVESIPLNGTTAPHYALKTVHQIQIGMFFGCLGLQAADQVQKSCVSPDPLP